MTDYLEEQRNELEALESIYPEEFEDLGEEGFKILVHPDDQDEAAPVVLTLNVKYTPQYPDELPETEVEVVSGELTGAQKERLHQAVQTAGEESLGMVMVFAMASVLKEELNNVLNESQRTQAAMEAEKRRLEEEREQAKFKGTKLTVERFMEWKAKFDKEMETQEEEERKARLRELKNRPTGRQLFEQDKSLAMSDSRYMDEGDVSVDASQFDREDRQDTDNEEEDDKDAVWRRFGSED
ncbi:ubiquitin-conjugating enzyme/RWD-like protein [Radiomyces spectabilis]|uniref:ubiquitin-conjugating enzyme/RWD-like protein n=1 Tax=Radiomyces spectabilis TaxID=64574 RepID=UPI00221FE0FF|nr:ubiquitin-conjugating enzyme/RWD-like protein [Radiomyces spectabilis]KAI8376177.1 ubiquitin-conjugating enzyme/RWD-like protein [Radiomyces spectabilis]